MKRERIADLQLFLVSAIWGMNFIAVKFLLLELSPVNLILVRFFGGSALLFFLLLFLDDVKISLRDFLVFCLLGLTGITVYQFFFTYGLKNTSAVNAALILNTGPIFGGLLSSLLGFEKLTRRQAAGIAGGFLGVYIIVTKGALVPGGGNVRGDIFMVFASILWALYTVLSKPALDRHSPLKVTTYAMLTGSLMLVPVAPFFLKPGELTTLSVTGWWWLFFAVVFSIVIAFHLWYRGVARLGAAGTMVFQYAIPVFAGTFAFAILGEPLYLSQLMGAVVVFVSIAVVRRR
jgi:drug/metabolite transporter (DMT)-like permease